MAGLPAGYGRRASRLSATSSAAGCTRALDVPVGLINDAWGGSACEAWIRRDILAADAKYAPMLKRWEKTRERLPSRPTGRRPSGAAKAKAEANSRPPAPGQPEI